MDYAAVFLVFVNLVSTQASYLDGSHRTKYMDNGCGTIAYVDPITNTRPAHLIFTPKKFDADAAITWKGDRDGTPDTFSNITENVRMFTEGEQFHLELSNISFFRDYLYFSVGYGACKSQRLELVTTDLGECGLLEIRPLNVTSGETAHVVYLPSSSVWSNRNSTTPNWLFRPSSCRKDCEAVNISEIFDVSTRTAEAEYDLVIPDIDQTRNGEYYVQCDDGTGTNNVSINVIVLEPPSKPVISPLVTIEGKQYIVGVNKEPLNIVCNTTGGTEPVTVRILVNNELVTSSLGAGGYTPNDHFKLTERHHKLEVACEVSNRVATPPLVTKAKIYMIQTPINPKLIGNEAIEYHPINITCSVTNARPAPNMVMVIRGSDVSVDTQTVFINDTASYTSKANLTRMERAWNGQGIQCCAYHELYRPTRTCSEQKTVSYKFRWYSLSMNLPSIVQEIRPYYVINVTCIVSNANPKCEPKWLGKTHMIIKQSPSYDVRTRDGGWTSEKTIVLNVTSTENGELIKCVAENSVFIENIIVYEIHVPALPEVRVNISGANTSVVETPFGEKLVLECSTTESMYLSEISWNYAGNKTDVNVTSCGSLSKCLTIDHAGSGHNGNYTCFAENRFGVVNKTIELVVQGRLASFKDVRLPFLTNLLLIVLGTCALLFLLSLLGTLIFIIARKTKGHNLSLVEERHHGDSPKSVDKERPIGKVTFDSTDYVVGFACQQFTQSPEVVNELPLMEDPLSVPDLMFTSKTFSSEPAEAKDLLSKDEPLEIAQAVGDVEQECSILTMEDIQKIEPLQQSTDEEMVPFTDHHEMTDEPITTVSIHF